MEKVGGESGGSPAVPGAGDGAQDPSALRHNLVELAVKFLKNPKVWERPMEDKKAFLRKKGLTELEIETAVSEATRSLPAVSTVSNGNAPPLPARPSTPIVLPTRSRTWSEYALMATVTGGVAYALIHFFKNYVIPWFNSPRVYEQRLDDIHASVGQLQTTVNETVSSLAESTRSIQLLLSEQQQHIQLLTTQVTGLQTTLAQQTSEPLRQLKEEMSSLKGIMLSRHQFPPTPTRGGVANGGGIPIWQRALDTATPTKTGEDELNLIQDSAKLSERNENETALQNGNGTVVQNGDGTGQSAEGLLQETSAS